MVDYPIGDLIAERVRAMGKAYDGTINDAVLAMCSGAMRKYLQSLNELPDMEGDAEAN